MDTATQILVIVVSSVLTLFLIIAIVLVILVIKLVGRVKKIVAAAEKVVDNAESATEILRNVSGPLGAAKLVYSLVNKARGRRK